MRNTKLRIVNYVIAVCNLLLAGVFYPLLPDRIPMNWSFDGTAAYSAKYEIFLMCGMGILIAFLLDVLPKIDPRRQNYQKFSSYYDSFCIVIQLFLLAMTGIILTESFRPGTVSVQYVVMLAVGLLLCISATSCLNSKAIFSAASRRRGPCPAKKSGAKASAWEENVFSSPGYWSSSPCCSQALRRRTRSF